MLADVSGSTPLYREYGDSEASRLVFECVEGMQRIATNRGGEFVRSKGDDVLCLFESADKALTTAREILDHGVLGSVSVHAGLHFGSVVWRGTELFGGAVNVASRLSGQAKSNEVLISREFVDRVGPNGGKELRPLGEITLRGTDTPTEIFALLAASEEDEDGVTRMMTQSTYFNVQRKEDVAGVELRLSYEDWSQGIMDGGQIKIGRSPQCELVMPQAWVSREHAVVSVRGGIVEYRDSSSAGSTLTINGSPQFYIRRQRVALTGKGHIELGSSVTGDDLPVINYEVVRNND